MTSSSIDVFIIRHGERLDEALRRQGQSVRDTHDIVDPPLTEEGHVQASLAFRNLLAALNPGRKIALLCSPCQRTIGTAMMVASVDHDICKKFEWSSLINSTTPTDVIPITVINGLADCAAAIKGLGGVKKVIESGLLPCASMPVNWTTENGPVRSAIETMRKVAASTLANASNATQCQFQANQRYETFPMTPPFVLSRDPYHSASSPPHTQTRQIVVNERFLGSFFRGVEIAAKNGCDTVIIVGHREGIRSLADQCLFRKRFHTTYCCIATLRVDWESEQAQLLSVLDHQDFSKQSIEELNASPI